MARRRKSKSKHKHKKRVTEPEPPTVTKPPIESTPEPTEPSNSGNISLNKLVAKQLDTDGSITVNYLNEAFINGKGRFYLFKKDEQSALAKQEQYLWGPNIEVSLDIKVDEVISSDKRFVNIGGPTNHFTDVVEGNSNGRNYSLVLRFDRSGVAFKKETIHGVYDEYEVNPMQCKIGEWYNVRYRQIVIEDNVVGLEGWINGKGIGTLADDGKMTKDTTKTDPIVGTDNALYYPIQNARQVWTVGAYSGCYIRLTGTVKTQIKNLSVREI